MIWLRFTANRLVLASALAIALAMAMCLLPACSTPGNANPAVTVRDAVDDYTWQELSSLSAAIADAPDDESAAQIAVAYHLAASDGTLDGTQTKDIELSDGTRTSAVILGFRHETAPDGSAVGISFAFTDAVALRGMNNDAGLGEFTSQDDTDAIGGWAASEARRWMNGGLLALMPFDLANAMRNVEKASIVVPEFELGGVSDQGTVDYSPEQVVGATVDTLWLLSVAEVSGVSANSEAAADRPEWNAILQAEGTQYQLFADTGIDEDHPNAGLVRTRANAPDRPCAWWLRSLENGTFADVRADGSVDRMEEASGGTELGIVPCFSV